MGIKNIKGGGKEYEKPLTMESMGKFTEFLKKHGFHILEVNVYKGTNTYHDDIEYTYLHLPFAFIDESVKNKFVEKYKDKEHINLGDIQHHSIDTCFNVILHQKILEL